MRYFMTVTPDGVPVTLFRFIVTDDAVREGVFAGGSWGDSEHTVAKALVEGSTHLEEITEEQARKDFPNAFVDPPS